MTRRLFLASIAAGPIEQLRPVLQSRVELKVGKTGFLSGKVHNLSFARFKGDVQDSGKLVFTVESKSIACEEDWVSEKDRRKIIAYALDDMLEAKRYPEIRWISSSPVPETKEATTIQGQLTIKDKTHPVAVSVNPQPEENGRKWWSGSAQIKLSDFDLERPSAAFGTIGTKDEMQLNFRLASAAEAQ